MQAGLQEVVRCTEKLRIFTLTALWSTPTAINFISNWIVATSDVSYRVERIIDMKYIAELGFTAYISMNSTIMNYNVSFDVCKLLENSSLICKINWNDLYFTMNRMNALNLNKLWENIWLHWEINNTSRIISLFMIISRRWNLSLYMKGLCSSTQLVEWKAFGFRNHIILFSLPLQNL